ncbi:MAG TPA: bifunctional [glutamine synthetase] adenylyltransferase/[glutamine synthetase]-adenylyl-L-tyrosine phosphorylase [Acidimicrobiales bacterium]|nr:bifunctional [glutamine synthetase] adenylyltransferase/[glutamine synthetase]-adenylyl-L-tyrosine phosphorylase [Acidimicrobiales bacterium]
MHLPPAVAAAIERSAAPAGVAIAVEQLGEPDPGLLERLDADPGLLDALVAVLGASRSLTQLCRTDPQALDVLANLDHRAAAPAGDPGAVVAWKRREFLRIAARDLTGRDELEAVGAALSRMADDVWAGLWSVPGVAVIAMGKYGGQELNYASDVDVMFVGDGDVRGPLTAARQCFRVDADLRPEGRSGALVRTIDAFAAYWERWAQTWEFQALLKARPAAGDAELGDRFARRAADAVWQRPFGADELREVRAMKARAEGEVHRKGLSDRELKRGRGGIRDIEFAVQLLQLVHGRADPTLRSPNTLSALATLGDAGYVDPADAAALAGAYRFLRAVEHRLQLWDEAQVHAVPTDFVAVERLARTCGFRATEDQTAAGAFADELRRQQATARSIHERLFFRPLLEAFTKVALTTGAVPTAAADRLAAFGFTDALRTRDALVELTRGLTRTSRLMQQTLPLLLEWLSESPDPDAGLLGLRTMVTKHHRAEALARMFRDAPDGARRLCLLLGSSRTVALGLERHPELVADLAEPTLPAPVTAARVREVMDRTLTWRPPAQRSAALRRLRQEQELSISIRDLLGRDDVDAVGASLTALAEAVLDGALGIARATTGVEVPVAVIAMGRFGGAELSYGSDLDVMVVHEGAAADAERLTTELRRLLNGPTPSEGLWAADFDLRPEGKQGTLSRSLAGFEQYYERWAATWERQALLRGRFAVGSAPLSERFAEVARAFLDRPLTDADEREVRRLKARIERERIPRGDDPDFHLKLGRGGLADVEWTVQLLQMRHRLFGFPGTLAALDALVAAGHMGAADAGDLRAAYVFCERTRNRLHLVRGRPGDALPARPEELGMLARSLGTTGPALRDGYRRATRRCRAVVERLFYGRP